MSLIAGLTDNARWVFGLAIVALFIPIVTHLLTRRREYQTARRKAAADFRAAFLSALNDIYPLPARWPDDIDPYLRGVFPKLQAAVEQFRPYVPFWKLGAYDRAWSRYRSCTGRQIDIQCYLHYMDIRDIDEARPLLDAKSTFHRIVWKPLRKPKRRGLDHIQKTTQEMTL